MESYNLGYVKGIKLGTIIGKTTAGYLTSPELEGNK